MLRSTLAVALSLGAGAALAQSVPCGVPYTIQRGDTLQRIAERAYGRGATFRDLWQVNRARLGTRDPSLIEVGQVIEVPCLDAGAAGVAPTARTIPAQAEPSATPPAPGAAPAITGEAAAAPIEAVPAPDAAAEAEAKAGWPPLPAQASGMLAEIVAAALARSPAAAVIGVAPDPFAGGRFALGYPWPRPDCTDPARLGAQSRAHCAAWRWSDPVYATVVAYLTRADAPPHDTPEALLGLRLCTASSMPDAVLEARGLTPPDVVLTAVPTSDDCLHALADGAVDVVAMDAGAADAAIARLGLGGQVVERSALAQVVPLHVVAPADSPDAAIALAALNEGLEDLRNSGAWFAIVSRALAAP